MWAKRFGNLNGTLYMDNNWDMIDLVVVPKHTKVWATITPQFFLKGESGKSIGIYA